MPRTAHLFYGPSPSGQRARGSRGRILRLRVVAVAAVSGTLLATVAVPPAHAADNPYQRGPTALPPQCSGTAPIRCHFEVAPGNYDVSVELGSATKAANTSMSVEARRQVLSAVSTGAGQVVRTTVTVNVRQPEGQPTGQGGTGRPGLDITFSGSEPAIGSLTVTAASPLVAYLAGDSTVCDQPAAPYTGWGQMLPAVVRNARWSRTTATRARVPAVSCPTGRFSPRSSR
jgi:hypothetical protein